VPKVFFHYADRVLSLNNKKKLRSYIESIFAKEKTSFFRLDYIFCSDEHLLAINRNFLKHDFYTDIITFNLSENKNIAGEVYISVDRVKENAKTLNLPFEEETLRVIFHGVLHLCGYKDKKKADIKQMREKENHYITIFRRSLNKRST